MDETVLIAMPVPSGGRMDFQSQERTFLLPVYFVFCQPVATPSNQIYKFIALKHLFFTRAPQKQSAHALQAVQNLRITLHVPTYKKNK